MINELLNHPALAQYYKTSQELYNFMGITIHSFDYKDDTLELLLTVPKHFQANENIIHGGIVCFILDSAAGIFGMLSNHSTDHKILTKRLDVSFKKPMHPDMAYTVSAHRMLVDDWTVQVTLENADGNTIATGEALLVFKDA